MDGTHYVDGEKTSHSGDYVLRAMMVPSGGKHTIEFKFEPEVDSNRYHHDY
jgi:hypothetical protein